jgi:phage terminase large subunit GpA-like protein
MAKYSREEIAELYLPERLSALEVIKKIRLNPNSNILGSIDIEMTPYLMAPVSLIGKNHVEWIFMLAPTQSGKTVFLQAAVADAIDQDPGTLLYVLPDEKLAKKMIKEKLIDMIRYTKEFKKKIIKLSFSKIDLNNMTIYPAWSGSLGSLSSIPCKKVVLDEIRLMKLEVGEESNAIKLANDRVTTYRAFGLAQGYGVSTPSCEGDLLYQQTIVPGTLVLRWHVRCENCNHAQVLDFFSQVFLKDGKAVCKCSACGHLFDESNNKKKMNATGFYAPFGSQEPFDLTKTPKRVFFWFDSMVSPFRSFQAIYDEWITTRDKIHDYKNFIQCWLARFWINDISKTSVANLRNLKVDFPTGLVPDWTRVIMAGVDTQDNGFFVTVRAFGDQRRTRVVTSFFIEHSMHIATGESIHELFKAQIEDAVYSTARGDKWKIAMWAIDTGGHRTKQVYEACDLCERVVKVKGSTPLQSVTIKYNSDINLYLVRTYEYLEETELLSELGGSLYELPSNISEDFLYQWCNIRKVKERNKKTGDEKTIWKKVGQCDYRFADIHSFICLDIETDFGTFRTELEKDGFSYNPYEFKLKVEEKQIQENIANQTRQVEDNYIVDTGYDIGTFKEGW